jgi:cytidine deaminase
MHTVPVRGKPGQPEFSEGWEPNVTETDWQRLEAAARLACANAYCPYSRFPVGAAVLASDGTVASGCNVENGSFGLTVCAERNAIFRAVAEGATSVVALVVYTPTPKPTTPCGACLQVIAEFGRDARIRMACASGEHDERAFGELLPHGFSLPIE